MQLLLPEETTQSPFPPRQRKLEMGRCEVRRKKARHE
jgi:hypothetical protein